MSETKELLLIAPKYGGQLTKLTFREPTAREYIKIGDPMQFGRSPQGTLYGAESEGVFESYFKALIVDTPVEQALQIGLADAMRAKDLIQSFFTSARDQIQSLDAGPTGEPNSSASATL